MLRNIMLTAIAAGAVHVANAQYKQEYVQSLNNHVYTTPALAGWHGGISFCNNTRFRDVNSDEFINVMSVDGYSHKIHTGFGVYYNAADLNKGQAFGANEMGAIVSPKFETGSGLYLMPCLGVELLRYRIGLPPVVLSEASYLSLSAGGALVYNRSIFGFNVEHINTPKPREKDSLFSDIPVRTSFLAAHRIELSQSFNLIPRVGYATQEGFNFISLGLNAQWKWIYAGVIYDWGNRTIFATGLEIKERFRIAYSCDFLSSDSDPFVFYAHEIGLRALLFDKTKVAKQFVKNLPVL